MEVAVTSESAANLNTQAVRLQAEGKLREAEGLYKRSLTILESTVGPDDLLVAQSLANRAALYRTMGEQHEAERIFQIAQRIWKKRGFPNTSDQAVWADQLRPDGLLNRYAEHVQALRNRVESGDSNARTELRDTLKRLGPWYHNVVFAEDVMSNPSNPQYPASRWQVLDAVIPKDLSGKSVLDIGCNSGFFSFEMKKRGARRVVGIDIMPHLLAEARFGSHWFNLPIELHECGAYDVRSLGESFDIVVFIGVLYHLKHPLYALEQIASICKETMYFQSVVRGPLGDVDPKDDYPSIEEAAFDDPAWPKLYFVEKKFNGDESNWWFATRSCLKAMVRTAGFAVEETKAPDIFVCPKK